LFNGQKLEEAKETEVYRLIIGNKVNGQIQLFVNVAWNRLIYPESLYVLDEDYLKMKNIAYAIF